MNCTLMLKAISKQIQMNRRSFLFRFFLIVFLTFAVTSCGCPHRLHPRKNPPPLPSFYVPNRIKVALILGSGGVRGMAHIGVLEELEAAGISVDLIVGCSAGAIVGALYADNPCVEEIKEAVWNLKTASLLDFDVVQCRYGLCQGRSLRKVLHQYLQSETFDQLQIPLVVVASDLNSGELVPIGAGSVEEAVQASSCIPFIFVPCEYMGRILVDGGIINPVPVKVARDLGAEVIIAVDLCELLPRTFPSNLFDVLTRSAEIAFLWQNESCSHHASVIIRPKTCDVGIFNDHMKRQIYYAGKRAAREKIPEILEKLAALEAEDCDKNEWRLATPRCYTPAIYLRP